MPPKVWRLVAALAIAAALTGPAVSAPEAAPSDAEDVLEAPPADVPPEADRLLWCASFYDAWSSAVHFQRRRAMEAELDGTAERLRARGLAALGPDYPGDTGDLVADYSEAYARTLHSDAPPRYSPEECEAAAGPTR